MPAVRRSSSTTPAVRERLGDLPRDPRGTVAGLGRGRADHLDDEREVGDVRSTPDASHAADGEPRGVGGRSLVAHPGSLACAPAHGTAAVWCVPRHARPGARGLQGPRPPAPPHGRDAVQASRVRPPDRRRPMSGSLRTLQRARVSVDRACAGRWHGKRLAERRLSVRRSRPAAGRSAVSNLIIVLGRGPGRGHGDRRRRRGGRRPHHRGRGRRPVGGPARSDVPRRPDVRPADVVYDRTGKVELGGSSGSSAGSYLSTEVPKLVLDATTTAEDRTFWTNGGFDPARDPRGGRRERLERRASAARRRSPSSSSGPGSCPRTSSRRAPTATCARRRS